jgi:type I restriction-modification system DNA methylase subunit
MGSNILYLRLNVNPNRDINSYSQSDYNLTIINYDYITENYYNTLRDKEGIVGMKALSNIAMLLFLKFVNPSVKSGTIDLLNIEKYRKEEGSSTDDKFQKYKEYIKYCQFDNIIENGKFKVQIPELIFIIEYIFKHVLWFHPYTKQIFADEFPSIKNEITYEQIIKQMDKINWDDMDIDVKGLAYEHFLKNEMGGGDLGQFFTRREVVDYMISVIKPYITETSTFIDPFMGTGTTAVVAKKLNRRFIGSEILKDYCKNYKKRLKEVGDLI